MRGFDSHTLPPVSSRSGYPAGCRLLLSSHRNQSPDEIERNPEQEKSVYMLMLIRTFLLAVAAFVAVVSAVFSPVQRRGR
jgi:hypothetical protein